MRVLDVDVLPMILILKFYLPILLGGQKGKCWRIINKQQVVASDFSQLQKVTSSNFSSLFAIIKTSTGVDGRFYYFLLNASLYIRNVRTRPGSSSSSNKKWNETSKYSTCRFIIVHFEHSVVNPFNPYKKKEKWQEILQVVENLFSYFYSK